MYDTQKNVSSICNCNCNLKIRFVKTPWFKRDQYIGCNMEPFKFLATSAVTELFPGIKQY